MHSCKRLHAISDSSAIDRQTRNAACRASPPVDDDSSSRSLKRVWLGSHLQHGLLMLLSLPSGCTRQQRSGQRQNRLPRSCLPQPTHPHPLRAASHPRPRRTLHLTVAPSRTAGAAATMGKSGGKTASETKTPANPTNFSDASIQSLHVLHEAGDHTPTVLLTVGDDRLCFNCGEGFQRCCTEKQVRAALVAARASCHTRSRAGGRAGATERNPSRQLTICCLLRVPSVLLTGDAHVRRLSGISTETSLSHLQPCDCCLII